MAFRLDALLVEKGLVKSRERAKELIKCGGVCVNGKVYCKASAAVDYSDEITVTGEQLKYVSRGGLKLEKAIKLYDISLNGLVCVDLGASTGGFTDCMLQNGADKVYAVDVGHGQLDAKLLNDGRVVNLEGINVKEFSVGYINRKVDFVTADLSFISVKNSLPVIKELLSEDKYAVILIKPQFEVGKSKIGKNGIVKDKVVHIELISTLIPYIESCGMSVCGLTCSSIKGGDGNIEYLALLKNEASQISFLSRLDVKKFVNDSFSELSDKKK